jgi:hypothetical protein
MVELRLPSIAGTDKEQLVQIRNYLYQIIPQLQYALSNVETSGESGYVVQHQNAAASSSPSQPFDAVIAFKDLKPLIIKSADIVQAYYEEINKKLEGIYVAESDFGTYAQQTELNIKATSTYVDQQFSNVQTIVTNVSDALEQYKVDVRAYIRHGEVGTDKNGYPVYGVEIGQSTDSNETNNKVETFARFTSDRLSFFDSSRAEVAYISNRKLYIKEVEILNKLTRGGFVEEINLTTGDVVEKWVGLGGDE